MYIQTIHGTFLAADRDGSLVQLQLSDDIKPNLISIPIKENPIMSGLLAGCSIEVGGSGIHIKRNGMYFCAALGVRNVIADRQIASDWETFWLIAVDKLDDEVVPDLPFINDHLQVCDRLWGRCRYVAANPSISTIQNCFYLPFSHSEPWGLFHTDGIPIISAATNPALYSQRLDTHLTADEITSCEDRTTYYYSGRFNAHFGHFIVDTLPRFWALKQLRGPDCKILCHTNENPNKWFDIPFLKVILCRLGLKPEDFAVFQHPIILKHVIVPNSSMDPQRLIHDVYGRFCREIAEPFLHGVSADCDDRPVYYSKTRLSVGLSTIANEIKIVEAFEEAGVDIVYPETLSFEDQIQLMTSKRHIIATPGSFLHAAIFCPPRKLTVLGLGREVNANFALIDAAANNNASYVWSTKMRPSSWIPKNFSFAHYLPNPKDVALKLLASALEQR